ncbi:hypothetical protein ACFQZC_01155 [Streptacidiphilus monticola]
MTGLLDRTLQAYGGYDRWKEVTSVTAHKRFGGAIWDIKQVPGIVDDGEIRVWIKDQRTSLWPFTGPHLKTAYTPDRVGIETTDGDVVEVLDHPARPSPGTPCKPLGRRCSWPTSPVTRCGRTPPSRSTSPCPACTPKKASPGQRTGSGGSGCT